MVQFARPEFLLLVLGVPVAIGLWLRKPRPAWRFSRIDLFAGLPAGRSRFVRWAGATLRVIALLALVLALAGVRWPDRSTRIPAEGIAIEMVVDVSGSMAESDFAWQGRPVPRLDAAKRAFRLFVEGGSGPDGQTLPGRPEDQIGLVTFATWPESPCPLTLSHDALLRLLDEQRPRTVPTEQTTNIGDAVAWALHRLEAASGRRKVIVLLSDGEHNVPPPALTPRQAAQLAANQGVVIHAIDAGGVTGDDPKATEARAAGESALRAVARVTGGQYFRAADGRALASACRDIDRLERHEIPSFRYRRYFEGAAWFGSASLVLWVGVFLLDHTLWRTLP